MIHISQYRTLKGNRKKVARCLFLVALISNQKRATSDQEHYLNSLKV